MKLTTTLIKEMIKKELKIILTESVPKEAKDKLFKRMKDKNQVPDDATIEDADFWEVKEGDYGFKSAVKVGDKYYYGEI